MLNSLEKEISNTKKEKKEKKTEKEKPKGENPKKKQIYSLDQIWSYVQQQIELIYED